MEYVLPVLAVVLILIGVAKANRNALMSGVVAGVFGFIIWSIIYTAEKQMMSELRATAQSINLTLVKADGSPRSWGNAELRHNACIVNVRWHAFQINPKDTPTYTFTFQEGSVLTDLTVQTLPDILAKQCAA